jgi:hypothetical protein
MGAGDELSAAAATTRWQRRPPEYRGAPKPLPPAEGRPSLGARQRAAVNVSSAPNTATRTQLGVADRRGRTLCQTFPQGMECQPGTTSGAAPASVAAADISALLPESVGQGSLVTEDQREVSRLAPRDDVAGKAQPLSGPLQAGVRLLPPPLPAASSASLTGRFPVLGSVRGTTGLPRFVAVPVWVRSRLSAGGASSAPEEFGASGPDHVPFGPSDAASCACPL